jgi:DNA-binding transcriptional LysR family regulator
MIDVGELNWDDVRVFLATMRASSLRQAADELGVSHPTAGRRLSALEDRLGLHLFERRSDGLHATPEAVKLAGAAEEVERAMLALGRIAQAADPELRGPVRVTLPEIFATDLLMPDLVAFSQRWPEIELQIDASYDVANLAQREADVAIRYMALDRLPSEDLTGRKAVTGHVAVYGVGDTWIGWRGAMQDASWIKDTPFPDLPVRGAMNNAGVQRSACAAGMGLTQLPCFYAEPLLTRRSEPQAAFDIWVLVHPDLRRNPRLRVFRDAVVDALKRHRKRLEGCRPAPDR